MKSRIGSLLIFSLLSFIVNGQEFNIKVNVNSPQNMTIDKSLFKDLEGKIYEFFNNNTWTEDQFRDEEKIDGQVTITVVKEIDANSFVADILFQTRRPVYNSNYNTTMLNHFDKGVEISYTTGQPIYRSEVSFYDNFSSILTYYAFIMLGYDYDSFSPLGGEDYFIKARDIISTLPSSVLTSAGWDNTGGIVGRNRYWLQENLLNPKLKPFRQFMYEYHRLGLDEFYKDPDRQRAILVSGISNLQEAISNYPNSMVLQLFSDAKHIELVDIFSIADKGQRRKVYDIMVQADPAQASRYSELNK